MKKKIKIIRFADNENNVLKGKYYFCEEVDIFALTGSAKSRKNETENVFYINEDTLVWAWNGEGFGTYINYGTPNEKIIGGDINFAKIETSKLPPKQWMILVPVWVVKMRVNMMQDLSVDGFAGYEHSEIVVA